MKLNRTEILPNMKTAVTRKQLQKSLLNSVDYKVIKGDMFGLSSMANTIKAAYFTFLVQHETKQS